MAPIGRYVAGVTFILLSICTAVLAMDGSQREEFQRIATLDILALTDEAQALLEQKYPEEDWGQYGFPDYVLADRSVEVGYKIAAKEPYDLKITMCYCLCDTLGHQSLLACFWKDGEVGGEFDEHGAGCTICYGQAMLAFLWKNLGASDEEVLLGMEEKFEPLIKDWEKFMDGSASPH